MATLNKTNLIVNYLPQNLTDDEFRLLFQKFGTVTGSKVAYKLLINKRFFKFLFTLFHFLKVF